MLFKRKKKKAKAEEGEAEQEQAEEAAPEGEEGAQAPEAEAPEAEEEAAEGGEEAKPKKKKKKKGGKRFLLLVVLLVVLGGGGGAGWYFFLRPHGDEDASLSRLAGGKSSEGPIYYTLPEFLVNLNSSSKQASFLKMTVVLQMLSEEDVKRVEANLPRVLDNMNTYLREMRVTDISGSAGIYRLREELLMRVNATMSPVKVEDILFKEIIIQ